MPKIATITAISTRFATEIVKIDQVRYLPGAVEIDGHRAIGLRGWGSLRSPGSRSETTDPLTVRHDGRLLAGKWVTRRRDLRPAVPVIAGQRWHGRTSPGRKAVWP